MALQQKFYNLKNTRVNLADGLAINALNIKIKRNLIYDEKKPGQALVPSQVYLGENLPDIEMEVYVDDIANPRTILPNQAIESFDIISPNDGDYSLLPDDFFTKFPPEGMVFGEPDMTLEGEKISTMTFPIRCNVLNPGDGGFPD